MGDNGKKAKTNRTQLWEIFIAFFKLGAISFGGGYAMVSLIEHETVDV